MGPTAREETAGLQATAAGQVDHSPSLWPWHSGHVPSPRCLNEQTHLCSQVEADFSSPCKQLLAFQWLPLACVAALSLGDVWTGFTIPWGLLKHFTQLLSWNLLGTHILLPLPGIFL